MNPIKSITILAASTLWLGACQSVDLSSGGSAVSAMAVPTCAVSPADYKLLAYWKDREADKNYARILDLLKKRYADAPGSDGKSALELAQRFVSARTDLKPQEIEATVEKACPKK
ncbi:MAG: hypothetical protein R3E83_14305 [Burkholderiaceae bacterium]